MNYDRFAKEKAEIRAAFDEWLHHYFEGDVPSAEVVGDLREAWGWSAVRVLYTGATIAERTYEGGCSCEEDASGYDFSGENSAQALRDLSDSLADDANGAVEGDEEVTTFSCQLMKP